MQAIAGGGNIHKAGKSGQSGNSGKSREPRIDHNWIGRERYVIRGGAVIAVPIMTGDKIEIIDPEGLQSAHVFAFNSAGENVTSALGVSLNTSAAGIAVMLAYSNNSQRIEPRAGARMIRRKLHKLSVKLLEHKAAKLLSGDTPPGSSITLTSEADFIMLLCAPGDPMRVDQPCVKQNHPPTDLIAFIKRSDSSVLLENAPENTLPEPLAAESLSIRIAAATAIAYEVKAGEYIQILDVQGRQCSDFQCFDQRQLDLGKERFLDATTTRSLMGNAYPTPGLHSKFYDTDFQPLVEVIQDTCGRHDSFGVACTSKYYDEAGYPGHVNCSENFNQALQPYAIEARPGWQAMNLFFNTFFDDAYTFTFDDPWSRPGDYVLMQAQTDLVCVSSACPCDIDPANGWVPTDIHIRTYSQKNLFKRAIAFRKTTDAEPEMTKETGFHSRTSELTRNFTEYNGYWLANHFNNHGVIAEYWACREGVVITDLSPLRKYEITGPDAEKLLQSCVTRDIRRLSDGQIVYTAMCYESGGMIDDGTVFRLAKTNFRWVGGSDDSGLWLREQAQKMKLRAWVKDSTSQLHNLQIQGPKSRQVLQKCIWTRPDQTALQELQWFRFSIARIGDANGVPIICSRTGYTGELGFEIFCHPRDATTVWDAVWQAGQEFSITPMGLEALDMLRIEAGLVFAGAEFCDQTDPFEAGIGFTAPLKSKQEDFIGKQALLKRKQNPQQKLVGLEISGEELAGNGDGIFIGREQIGAVTSGVVSPILSKNIALAKLKSVYSDIGTKVEIGKLDGHQKRIPAIVVSFPHFDPKKDRVKGVYA